MQPLLFFACVALLQFGADAARAGTFKVRLSSQPKTLDWHLATSGSEGAVLQNLMRGLPDLSRKRNWDRANKRLTVRLNTTHAWRDGTHLNCRHFLDSFERLLNPSLNSPNASLLFDVAGARDYFLGKEKRFGKVGVSCEGKDRLIFRLQHPRRDFEKIFTHWPTYPYRKDQPGQTLGDYELLDRGTLRLKKVNSAAQGPDAVQFVVVPDGSRALLDFESGKLQYLLQLEDELLKPDVLKIPGMGFVNPVRVVALLHFNPSRAPIQSPDVRRAVMRRIPVTELVAASPASRLPANSILPFGAPERELTAGPEGALPAVALTLGFPDDSLSRSIAQLIQDKAKGIKIKIEPLARSDRGRYDLILSLFGLDYLSPKQLLSAFLSQGALDFFNFSSATYLKLVQAAPDAQAAAYLQDEVALVMPLFYRRRAYLLHPSSVHEKGWEGSPVLGKIRPKT